METNIIRVILIDDHKVLRAGLRALLNDEPDISVVGEANDGAEGLALIEKLRPDVAVMDITMPVMNGLEAMRRLRESGPGTRTLALTMYNEEQYLLQVLEAGGYGFVTKSSADNDLIEAIRTVYRGEVFLYPSATRLLLQRYLAVTPGQPIVTESKQLTGALNGLSEREREVLTLTAAGYTSQEIGERLIISPKTVDTYRARVMDKLGLSHRAELVRFALQHGLLKP